MLCWLFGHDVCSMFEFNSQTLVYDHTYDKCLVCYKEWYRIPWYESERGME